MLVCSTDTTILNLEAFLGDASILIDFSRSCSLPADQAVMYPDLPEVLTLSADAHNQIAPEYLTSRPPIDK